MSILKELDEIIAKEKIKIVYQPIVSFDNGEIIGYEALSRGPENSLLSNPSLLFSLAEEHNKLWNLEKLCRKKAIEKASKLGIKKYLFLNIDPGIFNDPSFEKGYTKEHLKHNNIPTERIILEITERTCIKDYASFKAALTNYTEEGYKIAIDDTGAGYSGLRMLTEIKPNFVKIDMELIRDIDKDSFKQSLIESFVILANKTNMQLIAEGIETEEELRKLIELGVNCGQGYLLQRPSDSLLDISEKIKALIFKYKNIKNNKFLSYNSYCIGDIVTKSPAFGLNSKCKELKNFFDSSNHTGACIVTNKYPVGLVTRESLNSVLATQYGHAVFLKRPASLVMDTNPLIVDYNSLVSDVSKAAMDRSDETIYDYIIVTKNSKYYGIVTVKNLLLFTTDLERNYAKQLNPLTGLPGNELIESTINSIIKQKNEHCFLYFDLDNFKVYNDIYGFENGDKVIKMFASILQKNIKEVSPYNSFVGHIGGDDFIVIFEGCYNKAEALCKKIINDFDERILSFFNEKDRRNGFIEASDRKGNKDFFDLTSVSIAGAVGNLICFENSDDFAKYASHIKKEAKKIKGSSYIIKKIPICDESFKKSIV